MKNFLKITGLLLSLSTLVGCGVEISDNSDSNRSPSYDNFVRYTVSEIDRWGDVVKKLSTNCIDLEDDEDFGDIRIEDSRLDDALTFSWDNSFDEITFRLHQAGHVLNKSTYDIDYFVWNDVEQEVKTEEGVIFKLEVKKDSFCT